MIDFDGFAAFERDQIKRRGFAEFVRRAWKYIPRSRPLKWNWHMPEVCNHLEALFRGQYYDLAINIPPGQAKSAIASVAFPAWIWTEDPTAGILCASFEKDLAGRNAADCLTLLKSDWYIRRFGNVLGKHSAVGDFYSVAGGNRHTATPGGAGGGGRHFRLAVVDDPVKLSAGDANNPGKVAAVMATSTAWLSNTLATRKAELYLSTAVVMQRLHEQDASARLIENGAVHLCLPMKFESAHRCITPIGGDHRLVEGELLNTLRDTPESIEKTVRAMGGWQSQVVSAQMQQRPRPPGGKIFKKETFQHFARGDIKHELCNLVISVDANFNEKVTSDYVAVEVWGEYRSHYYCFYSANKHVGFLGALALIDGVRLIYPNAPVLIEEKANGAAIIETLRQTTGNVQACIPIGSKVSRAIAMNVHYASMHVWHMSAEWTATKEENLLAFPNGAHDDDVDATTQAIYWLSLGGATLEAAVSGWDKSGGSPALAALYKLR